MGKELYALDARSATGKAEILFRKLRNNFVTTSADCSDVLQVDCKEYQDFSEDKCEEEKKQKIITIERLVLSICMINMFKCLRDGKVTFI